MPVTQSQPIAIQAHGLRKSFRVRDQAVEAVSGLDLTVAAGQIFGFLGPNGAGKTTTLRILTTLLPADAGEAFVAGADVVRSPQRVRRRIGYVGQLGGADGSATGRENLLLQARLYGMTAAAASSRADELIELFDLGTFAGRVVRSYSGGQRRRLEVALGILHHPQVLFLDEPTTGLDPQNRANLWDQVRQLRDGGTTVFLTTHYLDDADQLSDRLAIVDRGRVIAEGTPAQLKQRYSGDTIVITPAGPADSLPSLERDLAGIPFVRSTRIRDGSIRLTVTDTTRSMAAVFGALADKDVAVRAASFAQPSLDDVFLHETGRSLRDTGEHTAEPGSGQSAGEQAAA
ncbi:MAG TPA: ATP-binding cassette domain-containing protein [Streptosporangiaceae bacterium]|nr:ATP-binding cassette domain-containing protein [Streptosporangiaceae bacterium]